MKNIRLKKTSQLYYDKYQFCLDFYFDELACIRQMPTDVAEIAYHVSRVWQYRKSMSKTYNYAGWWGRKQVISDSQVDLLINFATHVVTNADNKLVNCGQGGYLYSNDLQWLEFMSTQPGVGMSCFSKVDVVYPKGSVVLKKSLFSHRSYFRDQTISKDHKFKLGRFMLNQGDDIRLSPSLFQFLIKDKHTYLARNCFFDHNNIGHVAMLALMLPGVVRKTVTILVLNK